MPDKPKTIKRVLVKGHIRQTEKKVSTVKTHTRMEEVDIEQTKLDDVLKKAKELQVIVSGYDFNKSETGKISEEIVKMYRGKIHFTDDPLLNSEDGLRKAYDMQHSKVFEIGVNNELTPGTKEIFERLVDPEYILAITKKSEELEKHFADKLNQDMQRHDPFMFSFEAGKVEPDYKNLQSNQEDKKAPRLQQILGKKFDDIVANPEAIDTLNIDSWKALESFVTDVNISRKDFVDNAGPTQLLINLFNDPKNIFKEGQTTRLPQRVEGRILSEMEKAFDRDPYDPQKLREFLIDGIKTNKFKFKSTKDRLDLHNMIKSIGDGELVPFTYYMLNTTHVPTFLGEESGKKLLNEMKKLSSHIYDSVYSLSDEKRSIFVSKNPMDMLTMASEGKLDTCQSLTKDGKPNIGYDHANIMASINMDKVDDFVMFTGGKTKDGKLFKSARATLSWNPKNGKFYHHEDTKVYGENKSDRAFLENFINKTLKPTRTADHKLGQLEKHQRSITINMRAMFAEKMGSIVGKIQKEMQEGNDTNGLLNEGDSMFNKGSAYEEIINQYFKPLNERYTNMLNKNELKSLTYASPLHQELEQFKQVSNELRNQIPGLIKEGKSKQNKFKSSIKGKKLKIVQPLQMR